MKNKFFLFIGIFLFIFLLIGIIFYQQKNQKDFSSQAPLDKAISATPKVINSNSNSKNTPALIVNKPQESALPKGELAAKQAVESFLRKKNPSGEWRVSTTQEVVTQISGASLIGYISEEQKLSLAKDLAEAMGVPNEQVFIGTEQLPPSGLSLTINFQQKVSEYKVIGADMKFFYKNNNSHEIYFITNAIRPIVPPDLTIALSYQQGSKAIDQKYGDGQWQLQSQEATPKIWPESHSRTCLVYTYTVQLLAKNDTRLIYINTKDGKILFDQTTHINN